MNATMEQYSSWRHTIASNSELAQLWGDGHGDEAAFTDAEQIRFDLMLDDNFWLNYQFWDRARIGAISQDWEVGALAATVRLIDQSDAGNKWWNENSSAFPQDYVEGIEALRLEVQ